MNATLVLLGVLALLFVGFTFVFVKDYLGHKDQWEPGTSFVKSGIIGLVVNFFDTLGIGSFAPTTALLRTFKQIDDRVLPGTLNVAMTIPVIVEAFAFIRAVEVEPVTLTAMIVAASVGSYVGAGFMSKLPKQTVQKTMAVALSIAGLIMLAQILGIFPGGGEAIGLTGVALVIGVVGNLILGALMTAGVGLYAPCMALVYLLGMSPAVAFPIMMASCAYLMPICSVKFIKEGAYNRRASMAISIFGVVGVLIAVFLVTSLPLDILKWLVVGVIAYTSFSMFKASKTA
ncbi:MAG: sulfite exporter TauE/SafE family protein [Proteocatella sp.]